MKAELPCHVAFGGDLDGCAYGSNNWIWRSDPHVISFLSRVQHMPLTKFSCACACHFSSLLVKSQTLTMPSPLPLAKCSSELGSFANEYTPSTWPGSKSPRKGCANMRSTFVAFRALVYSRARSNGWRLGSKFLVTLATLEPGACVEAVDRLRALIFIFVVVQLSTVAAAKFWRVLRISRHGRGPPAPKTLAWRRRTQRGSEYCTHFPQPRTATKYPSLTRTTAKMKL